MAWRDHLMIDRSAKTVSDIYLSTVRSLFTWAAENDRLPGNVAVTVRQRKPKRFYARERDYTDAEVVQVLKLSRSYKPHADDFGYIRVFRSLSSQNGGC